MQNWKKYVFAALTGGGIAAGAALTSLWLLTRLGSLLQLLKLGMEAEELAHWTAVLDQLREARIALPWLIVIMIGMILGAALYAATRRCSKRKLVLSLVSVPLFLVMVLGTAACTEVNGLRPAGFAVKPLGNSREIRQQSFVSQGESWYFGFGRRQILPDENSPQPLYIAGYNNGVEITDVLDPCEARALWLDTGKEGILLIGVDAVALDSGVVSAIRERLADVEGCRAVHVYSTHTHAGADTLGLWGPVAIDGKNDAYMESLLKAAEEAGREAASSRRKGTLSYAKTETTDMYRDSRDPQVYDANLYQLRFASEEGKSGVRLLFYGAHAESLRGDNTLLSRDFPGLLCDGVTQATGDDTMFFPGAIGGLIMTREFRPTFANPLPNYHITGEKLVEYALKIGGEGEERLEPAMKLGTAQFVVPMDNVGFWLYKFLGILSNKPVIAASATGYGVETELSVLMLDDLALTLIPGEIFPELVYGGEYGDAAPENENPEPLTEIAARYGVETLLVAGLANDEIGYIVPPSDFLLNKKMPYLEKTMDYKGENHYEETNSIGPECAHVIARAFEAALVSVGCEIP